MISKRLHTILSMLAPCRLLADIGCDHGYICMEAVNGGIAQSALACDVAEGPLEIAGSNIKAAGLDDRINCILSDGLSEIPEGCPVDCINITGMGGILMVRILKALETEDPRFAGLKQLILGPQSDMDLVRREILDNLHFTIAKEVTVEEDGKYYTLLDVRPGEMTPALDAPEMAGLKDQTSEEASEARLNTSTDSREAGVNDHKLADRPAMTPYTESEYLYGRKDTADPKTLDVRQRFLEYQLKLQEEAYHGALKGCSFGAAEKIAALKQKMAWTKEALET